MADVPEIGRERVLAHRVAAHQFDRPGLRPADLDVLDLGVQDTPCGSVRLALAARVPAAAGLDDDRLELVWSVRGAPHLHRRDGLPGLAAALWPLSDADAARRIAGQIRDGARLGLAAFRVTAEAFRAVVTTAMDKGEVSRAVTDRIPAELSYDCRACGARHVSGALFQQAGLAGGVRLEVRGRSARLAPLAERPAPPAGAGGTDALVLACYLPATRTCRPATGTCWSRRRPTSSSCGGCWATRGRCSSTARWPAPGARSEAARGRLDLTVTPFAELPKRVVRELNGEAETVRAARGASEVRLTVAAD